MSSYDVRLIRRLDDNNAFKEAILGMGFDGHQYQFTAEETVAIAGGFIDR
jgi:hypothetical protein